MEKQPLKPRFVCMPQLVLINHSWPDINTIVKNVWKWLISRLKPTFHNFYVLRIKFYSVISQPAVFSVATGSSIMSTITFLLLKQGCCDNNTSVRTVRRIYGIGLSRPLKQNDSCVFQRADCLIANCNCDCWSPACGLSKEGIRCVSLLVQDHKYWTEGIFCN